jgi:pimeloyl-ACP methyl ester carboxylesterase
LKSEEEGRMAATIPIVFIHGLKGSSIVDEHNHTHYINLWQGLGLSAPPLALPLQWEGGKQNSDGLKAGKIFEKIAHVEVYGPFLRFLESFNRPSYTFAYDWRRDLNETVEKFQTFLREIHAKHKSKIQIVAHSMGGLITLASVNTHNGVLVGNPQPPKSDKDTVKPASSDGATVFTASEVPASASGSAEVSRVIDIVDSILFAGCPFRTGVGFLRDLMVGVPNGYNHRILSPSVLFTFPSIYTFFPTPENSQIVDEKGDFIPVNFYSTEDWIKFKLGIFNKTTPTQEQITHLDHCTLQAKLLRSKLVALDISYPPIAVLSSHKHITERRFKLINGELDFKDAITAMGDDRIINATPPDGIPNKEYETDNSHSALLSDLPVVKQILLDLLAGFN